MRQRLHINKHLLCEKIGGRKYSICLVRGNKDYGGHFWACCNWGKDDLQADWVNYKTGEIEPYIRNGKVINNEEENQNKVELPPPEDAKSIKEAYLKAKKSIKNGFV